MNRARTAIGLMAMALILNASAGDAKAQARTVPGDILRGEGAFLRGAGWYNLHTAEARSINVDTAIRWNRAVYLAYKQAEKDRSERIARRTRLSNATIAQHEKERAEHERRIRDNPSPGDISSGDALNALLVDLSDPLIPSPAWASHEVPLPQGFSVKAVPFKFVVAGGDQVAMHLGEGTISIDRMLMSDHWPVFMRLAALEPEEKAYAKAVSKVLDQCRKNELTLDAALDVQKAAEALKMKAAEAVPVQNGLQLKAINLTKELIGAAVIFTTQDYAQELIRDTQEHEARTVEELLAFMRKFRLEFAETGGRPEEGQLFEGLFGALRQQKDALGAGPAPAEVAHRGPMTKAERGPSTKQGRGPSTKQSRAAHAPSPAGRWEYGIESQTLHEIHFKPDGAVAGPRGRHLGRWRQSDSTITIHWDEAHGPDGSPVDTVDIGPAGKHLRGTSQKGATVVANRLGD